MIRTAAIAGAALGFLIAVFVFVGRGGGSGAKLTTRPVTAKILSPSVKFRTSAGGVLNELSSSDKLTEKAVIETDATGLGEFKYADGSVVRVGASSNFSFTKTRSQGSKRDIASRLVTGKSWHRVTPGFGESSDYQVTVLGATSKVVGTSFAVVCPLETDCFYTLVRGRLHVEDSANHTADLKAGDQVEVKFGRLDPVKHLSDDELASDPWITQNLTLDGDSAPATVEETTTSIDGETTTSLTGDSTTSIAGGSTTRTTARSGGGSTQTTQPSTGTTQPTTATTQPQATTTTTPATTTTKVGICKQTSTTKRPAQCPPH